MADDKDDENVEDYDHFDGVVTNTWIKKKITDK